MGVEFPATPLSLGNGTITCKLNDLDGDLTDDTSDTAELYGIGRVGDAVHVCKVTIEPADASGEMAIVASGWEDADAP